MPARGAPAPAAGAEATQGSSPRYLESPFGVDLDAIDLSSTEAVAGDGGGGDGPAPPAALDDAVTAFEERTLGAPVDAAASAPAAGPRETSGAAAASEPGAPRAAQSTPAAGGGAGGLGEAAEAVVRGIASTARAFIDHLRQIVTGGPAAGPAAAPTATPAPASTAQPASPAQVASPGTQPPAAQGDVAADTLEGRRRFATLYQSYQARLGPEEQQALQAFQQSWALPERCPFARNAQLTGEEKGILAGAMLVATGTRGTDCGDWVMRSYQYAEGDPYISRPDWPRQHARGVRYAENRWRSLAWTNTAINPTQLSLIEAGRWVMYDNGSGGGHSILVVRVIERNERRGTISVEAMESGWFHDVNITPRYRTIDLNCGTATTRDGQVVRQRQAGAIFSVQRPERSAAYERWLAARATP